MRHKVKLKSQTDPTGGKQVKKEIEALKAHQSRLFDGDNISLSSRFSFCRFSIISFCCFTVFTSSIMLLLTSWSPLISMWQQFVDSVSSILGNL